MDLKSFITNADDSPFSLYNLPYGVFKTASSSYRVGVAIGDYVLDLAYLEQQQLFKPILDNPLFNQDSLNDFAIQGPKVWSKVRQHIQRLLSKNEPRLRDHPDLYERALISQTAVQLKIPFHCEAFTDFYASEHHASNVGTLFRSKEAPLLPNWKYLPVAYNGRASTIFSSNTPIHRPNGQVKLPDATAPSFMPTTKLDFELEMGCFIGVGNPNGTPITIANAHDHLFGMVLLNDWSARDIQAFEYQPLGPFLAKSFATTISPWVVPMAALQPYLQSLPTQNPEPVSYLKQVHRQLPSIQLTVDLKTKQNPTEIRLCETNLTEIYWTLEQMLAHHTVNGCIMQPGDLFATGTISGANKSAWGSLLERTFNGTAPLQLPQGEIRRFLEDGDTIIISGYAQKEGLPRIGFGTLVNTIVNETC